MPGLPLVGEEFAGYRLRAVLGRGGMSTVFRAENPRLGNVIALKVMAWELASDDVFRARFFEESRIAAGLNHPNVIPIHDSGSSGGLLYIAMRYVTGIDLRQMVKEHGRLPAGTAIFLLSQAARALDAAHRQGLVHRDVKPGNLLVEHASDDADPDHVYLSDFGISKNVGERSGLTPTGQFLGTLDYIAPEQIRGLPVTGLADQYSLGCVLYECLTGRVPFERDLHAAIIAAHVEERPPPPTRVRSDLPPEVDPVFARVLAKRPADRYASCREFMAAAREALGPLAERPGADRPARRPGVRPGTGTGRFSALVVADPFDRPAEVAHAEAGPRADGTQSIPGQAAWAGNDAPAGWHPNAAHPNAAHPNVAHPNVAHPPAPRLVPPAWPAPGDNTRTAHPRTEGAGSRSGSRPLASPPLVSPSPASPVHASPPPASPPSASSPPDHGRSRRRRRRGGPRSWTAVVLSAVLLVVAGVLIGLKMTAGTSEHLASSGNDSTPGSRASASASHTVTGSPSPTATPSSSMNMGMVGGDGQSGPGTLAGVLAAANSSEEGKGLLPAANCDGYRQNADGQIICTNPTPGVAQIYYQNASSLKALYSLYESQVTALDGGQPFRQNTGTCGPSTVPYAEFAWNMEQGHPHNYTAAQMAAGEVPQIDAGGRMACFAVNTAHGVTEYIVWTIDNGPALGVADGSPAAVYELWASLHHAVMFRGTEMCGSNGRMNMSDIPTGNLEVISACPAGVQGVT